MRQNEMAEAPNFDRKTFEYLGRNQKAFSCFKYTTTGRISQCKKCGSDYMRASFDGFCQRCLQQVEFITRERPDITAVITYRGAKRR